MSQAEQTWMSCIVSDASFYKDPRVLMTRREPAVEHGFHISTPVYECVLRGSIHAIGRYGGYTDTSRPYQYQAAYKMGARFAKTGRNFAAIVGKSVFRELHQVQKKLISCFEDGYVEQFEHDRFGEVRRDAYKSLTIINHYHPLHIVMIDMDGDRRGAILALAAAYRESYRGEKA